MNKDENYKTADFSVISSLSYLGFPMNGFERDTKWPEKIIVHFNYSKELDQALQALWAKELRVEPLAFLEITRAVKARMRDCA